MNLLNLFKPKPKAPTIESYGQPTTIDPQELQSIMEWLFGSLMNAGYFGKSHIIWYDSDNPDPSQENLVAKLSRNLKEPVFLYRLGGRVQLAPDEFYWRMIQEHPSMRVYQLEMKDKE